ncbi:MAG: hypothetical protein KF857_05395 [Fimbriimonadaceae bacterium]|nr:hypothetical protein [Fimbriimonadaceae bacterium]
MRSKSKLPLASSATAWSLSLSLALLSAGCATGPAPAASAAPTATQAKAAPRTQDTAPTLPDSLAKSDLYIFSAGGRISYGDDIDVALNEGGFKRPERSASVNRVPGGLGNNYQCYGWETANRAFGVLARKGKVVLALDTYEHADQQALDDLRAAYIKLNGQPVSVEGTHVHYDFWSTGEARLMLCSTVNELGVLSFSVALGNRDLMTFFRMDPESAKDDQAASDRLFTTRGTTSGN